MITRAFFFLICLQLSVEFTPGWSADAAGDGKRTRVVCFGDSITKRGYFKILASLTGVEAINAGVGGNSTAKALRRMDADVLAKKPDAVVIFFGTNDLRADADHAYVPIPRYISNLESMIAKCRQHAATVILCTLPPIEHRAFFKRHERGPFEALGGLAKLIEDYRQAAIQVAREQGVLLVDLNQSLALEPQWLSHDGVHPSVDGNAIIAKHIARALVSMLADQRQGAQPNRETKRADIIVFGATSAGVVAAVQAARSGKTVLLLEPHDHVGGLTTGGLGATDIGNKDVIGGLSREFYQRVARHYQNDASWSRETRAEFFASRSKRTQMEETLGENGTMWTFEPSVATKIFDEMLAEAGVVVRRRQKLKAVVKEGARLTQIKTLGGNLYQASVFIDATYEGDLMAKSGVTYRVGREANSEYNETLNGIRAKTPKNQIYGSIDPYRVPGEPSSGLIPLIQDGDGGVPGEGDRRVQAYNFRLCFTDVASNRLPLTAPSDYAPERYELAARRAEKIVASGVAPVLKHFCNPVWMPNRKTDINNSQGISTDFIGANYEYPDADYDKRAKIWQEHEDYVRGFWYFMSTSDRIPESLRAQFQSLGPCRDEFQSADGWPAQLYVREARRMVSGYVMTEHNCRSSLVAEDSVGMAAYGMDSHNCQRIVKNHSARNEGDVQAHGLRPYPISYRSIIPRRQQCENLLVPVCLSATHIAFGSIRMEPVFMVLGQSSAIAASLAIDEGVPVQDLQYEQLGPALLAAGQVLKRSGSAQAAGPAAWTNATGNGSWHDPKNWVSGKLPTVRDGVLVDRAGERLARITKDVPGNLGSLYVGSEGGQFGELTIEGGTLDVTSISSRKNRIGLRGGKGIVRQTGGIVTLNSLQIALDAQSEGLYHLSGGQLRLTRQVDGSIGSLDIGDTNAEGSGTFVISGGSLETRSGVTLGRSDGLASFVLDGSGAEKISIGSMETSGGFWMQHTGSTLKVVIDDVGATPIQVHGSDDKSQASVTFDKRSLLDVEFADSARSGTWDVMRWSGHLADQGLVFTESVDTDAWRFDLIDTDGRGGEDTLRMTYSASNQKQ